MIDNIFDDMMLMFIKGHRGIRKQKILCSLSATFSNDLDEILRDVMTFSYHFHFYCTAYNPRESLVQQ